MNFNIIFIKIFVFLAFFASTTLVAEYSFSQNIPITTDSRIKTLVYNPNEVYQLKFHYGYQSFIEFSDNENIEIISIGESFAWKITPAEKRLFIRALEIGSHTNMTIITNKRTYQFDITSTEYDGRADDELVYTVRFYYPEINTPLPIPPQLSQQNPSALKSNNSTDMPTRLMEMQQNQNSGQPFMSVVKNPIPTQFVDKPLTPEVSFDKGSGQLNFSYSIAGKSEKITPLKIYDDGKETFFQFKDKNLLVPIISVVDDYGGEKSYGYGIREGFIVVPQTAKQFTLRLGDGLICVFNEKYVNRPKGARNNFYQRIR